MIKDINVEEQLIKIGHNLHTIRNYKKEKLEGVAKSIGITHSVLSKIENGRYDGLTVTLLIKLCNHYQVTLQQVLELGLTQIYTKSQINETGTANNTLKNIEHEVSSGYEKAIEQNVSEIAYLRKKLDELLAREDK
jgi:DNA-binding Xre family transcriptional regulator